MYFSLQYVCVYCMLWMKWKWTWISVGNNFLKKKISKDRKQEDSFFHRHHLPSLQRVALSCFHPSFYSRYIFLHLTFLLFSPGLLWSVLQDISLLASQSVIASRKREKDKEGIHDEGQVFLDRLSYQKVLSLVHSIEFWKMWHMNDWSLQEV